MTHVMFDSVDAASFPVSGFDATAGYTTGRYPSSKPIRARFPNLPHLTIAVTAREDADCLDVEPGDATPAEAPVWFDRRPGNRVIYCSASTINQVRAAMGNRDYLLWSAHYTGKPHICGSGCGYPAADATQWWDHGPNGENVDQSLLSDKFWASITGDDMPSSQEVAAAVWGQGGAQDLLRQAAADAAEARRLMESIGTLVWTNSGAGDWMRGTGATVDRIDQATGVDLNDRVWTQSGAGDALRDIVARLDRIEKSIGVVSVDPTNPTLGSVE